MFALSKAVAICMSLGTLFAGVVTAFALSGKPVLLHSPGDWDCACGEIYIKTTMHPLWNPFRDREPEAVADSFLSSVRSGTCPVGLELCRTSSSSHRVSDWKLSFREDKGSTADLYYKLTKYGVEQQFHHNGVGTIAVQKTVNGWRVVSFDSYF